MEDPFREIATRIKQSDAAALKSLFHQLFKSLHFFILMKTHDSETAKDLVQDTFIKVWESRYHLDENRSLKAFVYKVANNLTLNHLRHLKVKSNLIQYFEVEPISEGTPHSTLEDKEFQKQLLGFIEQLPLQTRTVFLMSRMEDLSYQEIADRLDISIKTVESHIGKALKRLREQLHALK